MLNDQYKIIWDGEESPTGLGDSSVFLGPDKMCYKLYPHLDIDIIKRYHEIQNIFSENHFTIDVDKYKGGKISRICIDILNLGNDIVKEYNPHYGKDVVISKIPYIDGSALMDLNRTKTLNLVDRIELYKRILELRDQMNQNHLIMEYQQGVRMCSSFSEVYNAKVLGIDPAGVVSITITDLATNIEHYVEYYKNSIMKTIR